MLQITAVRERIMRQIRKAEMTSTNNLQQENIPEFDETAEEASIYKVNNVRRISQNIFAIQATRRQRMGLWRTSRNMIVIRSRQDEELTLINAIRLDIPGEELLQSLGYVARVIRLGCSLGHHHDWHYKMMHGAQIWAPGISSTYRIPYVDRIIHENTVLPFAKSEIFIFDSALVEPEAAILIRLSSSTNRPVHSNHGTHTIMCESSSSDESTYHSSIMKAQQQQNIKGLLLVSEALQPQLHNELLNITSRTILQMRGMMESGIVIPSKWLRSQQTEKGKIRDDFERLLKLDFNRLISAQGAPVPQRAKEEVVMAVERAFPVW